ncbi:Crotonyl-CoA reductase [Nymphon striatum]|nr:Crotonyl-CoA reductase [Nymphon striatum]
MLAKAVYRIETAKTNDKVFNGIPEEATVIFVMNHRSNMDYMLVTYLAARDSALSYAAGVNYNGVWASLGEPISPFDGHKQPFHIAGSDAAGIVWAVGDKVKRWKVGDEVVIHCNQDDGDDEECNGGDPMYSPTQRIWGYETPDGSFAQFTNVQAQQLMPRPKHLTWEEAACYTLTLATAYRMLFGHEPHDLKPGQNVLVWGASGGLGSYAIQLINTAGANAIGSRTSPNATL